MWNPDKELKVALVSKNVNPRLLPVESGQGIESRMWGQGDGAVIATWNPDKELKGMVTCRNHPDVI